MDALEWTRLYMDHYSPRASRSTPPALLEAWQRCGLDAQSNEFCDRGRRTAERLAHGEAPPAPKDW